MNGHVNVRFLTGGLFILIVLEGLTMAPQVYSACTTDYHNEWVHYSPFGNNCRRYLDFAQGFYDRADGPGNGNRIVNDGRDNDVQYMSECADDCGALWPQKSSMDQHPYATVDGEGTEPYKYCDDM